uniref:Putative hemagglutinin esterase protein n=1 Tax=Pilchard orthomyxovirus TaxID=2732827 RepID=A0A6M4AL92_9ORTO|nr:putative hemagglutinin esterase protein [Pilchard orthomyxovirus]
MALSTILLIIAFSTFTAGQLDTDDVCFANANGVSWIGDSRTDLRVNQQSADFVGNRYFETHSTNGNGLVAQMIPRFNKDFYLPKPGRRLMYIGVNDCRLGDDFFNAPGSLTKDQVFSIMYKGYCFNDVSVEETLIGSSTQLFPSRFTWKGYSVRNYETRDSSPNIVIGESSTANRGSEYVFFACFQNTPGNTGKIAGVDGSINGKCGFFNKPLELDLFRGQIHVSKTIMFGSKSSGCVLFTSYGATPTCHALSAVWRDPEIQARLALTPSAPGGTYPADGFDSLHGSASVRAFFRERFNGRCEGVDWFQERGIFCKYENCHKELHTKYNKFNELEAKNTQLSSNVARVESAANTRMGGFDSSIQVLVSKDEDIVKRVSTIEDLLDSPKNLTGHEALMLRVVQLESMQKKHGEKMDEKAKKDDVFRSIGIGAVGIAGVVFLMLLVRRVVAYNIHRREHGVCKSLCL